jgi:hypothetical protein
MASSIFDWFGDDGDEDDGFGEFEDFDEVAEPQGEFDAPADPGDDEEDDASAPDATSTDGGDPGTTSVERRVDDLEADLEDVDAQLTAVRESQDSVAERVDEMNDRVRRLVGLYDRVAAESNPFATDDGGFGVVGDQDSADLDRLERAAERPDDHAGGTGTDGAVGDGDDEATENGPGGTVDYDDLAAAEGGADGDSPVGRGDGTTTRTGDGAAADGADGPVAAAAGSDGSAGDPILESLGDSYASTVLGFGWLADMVAVGGPAGALRALEHYETIGWLGRDARAELETMLSGPGLDVDVDPSDPQELSADEHALSYEYVRMLAGIRSFDDAF